MQPLQRIISNTHSKFLKLLCKSHNNTAEYTIDNFLQPNNTGHSQIYFLMYIFTDNKILIVYMVWVIMSYIYCAGIPGCCITNKMFCNMRFALPSFADFKKC